MAYDGVRGRAVLFSGVGVNGGGNPADTWEWDGSNWSQRSPATSPAARTGHAMAFDSGRGVTVLFGGMYYRNDTWEWDGNNWIPRAPPVSPPVRFGHALAYDSGRGVTVLFGGAGDSGPRNDTWEWNGAA